MGKLNDKAVRAAKVESGEKFLSDGGGLYLRVRAVDAPKVWFYRYTMNGIARKIRLGVFGDSANAMALADARTKANDMTALRRQGIDPVLDAEAKDAARQAAIEAEARAAAAEAAKITVSTLFERWASVDLVRRKDGGSEVRRMFEKDVLPTLGTMLVEDVRKGHITGITDALLARGVTRMAKLIFSLMRQMFRFAVDRGIVEFEPTAAIRKAKIGGKDTERDRVLSDDEIKALARQLPKAGMSDTATAAVWIAVSTCCRIGELMAARWSM